MSVTVLRGDCREVLRTLPDNSVHCVVTSPPYWGLRDYGTATWEGGDAGCKHEAPQEWIDKQFNANSAFGNGAATQSAAAKGRWYKPDGSCRCGARRIDSQLGLEPDFNTYIAEMVAVFREVRRVLRSDGTLWLNLGDSYCSRGGLHDGRDENRNGVFAVGLKPKDLCGIPWRVAFALQADGWWLRQDIIWSKPNPMPESVTDRCTKAHEYIFLMSKSARYYYDAETIAEAVSLNTHARLAQDVEAQIGSARAHAGGKTNVNMKAVFNHKMAAAGSGIKNNESFASAVSLRVERRNKRSVWEIATAPFSEAHFATFPPALIEPCIKAGCPKDGTVLDPFGGAGTTGLVADRLQRNAILIELSSHYADMAEERINGDAPLAGIWSAGDQAGVAEAAAQHQAELGVD